MIHSMTPFSVKLPVTGEAPGHYHHAWAADNSLCRGCPATCVAKRETEGKSYSKYFILYAYHKVELIKISWLFTSISMVVWIDLVCYFMMTENGNLQMLKTNFRKKHTMFSKYFRLCKTELKNELTKKPQTYRTSQATKKMIIILRGH